MPRFIPIDKMKSLREASKSGDDRAKKILSMQLEDKEDFSSLLDEFFAPKTEQNVEVIGDQKEEIDERLEQFLKDNQVDKNSPYYQDFVDDYYKENPKKFKKENIDCKEEKDDIKCLLDSVINSISSCDSVVISLMNNESEQSDTTIKGAMATLQEIKQNQLDIVDKIRRLKTSLAKKEEKVV